MTGRTNDPENRAQVSSADSFGFHVWENGSSMSFLEPSTQLPLVEETENDSDREKNSSSALAPCGCSNEIPQALCLKPHAHNLFRFWKSEVQEES